MRVHTYQNPVSKQEARKPITKAEARAHSDAPHAASEWQAEEEAAAVFSYASPQGGYTGYTRYAAQAESSPEAALLEELAEENAALLESMLGEAQQEKEAAEAALQSAKEKAEEKMAGALQALGMLEQKERNAATSNANIKDMSGILTRRLVSATTRMEVHNISSSAYKELGELRMIAATATGEDAKKARAIVKKLEKLVSRCTRKLADLSTEEHMQRKSKRAKKSGQERRAKEIEEELKRKMLRRKQRERKYLQEHDKKEPGKDNTLLDALHGKLSAAEEAALAAKAETQAAIELASPSAGGDSAAGGEGGSASTTGASAAGTPTAGAGGGGGGEASAEGSGEDS